MLAPSSCCRLRALRTGLVVAALVMCTGLLGGAASPALALTVKRSWHRAVSFDGSGCHSASVVRLRLPRGARHLHVWSPRVGQRFHDVDTNRVVARVTRIAKSRTHLRIVARGMGDACSDPDAYEGTGWQTYDAPLRARYERKVGVYFYWFCGQDRVRPSSIIATC